MRVREAMRRMHENIRHQKRLITVLERVSARADADIVRLQRELRRQREITIPESVVNKIIEDMCYHMGTEFAQRVQGSSLAPLNIVREVATQVMKEGMRYHSLCTLSNPMKMYVREEVEDGNLRFTLTTGGPVAIHHLLRLDRERTFPYPVQRHIARDERERFYTLDTLEEAVTSYGKDVEPTRTSPKARSLFFSD